MKSNLSILFVVTVLFSSSLKSQSITENVRVNKKWGPNDTILVSTILYNGEILPYRELEEVWASNTLSGKKLEKAKNEYHRLRNAVYVTYPYARQAAIVINEINSELQNNTSKKSRKQLIKEREEDLRQKFTQPLTKLSVYQGKILMKILNRQTGNNCYDIIKEYKGGLNARLYQTVAFFWGSNLKQDWDLAQNSTDRDINNIIREINYKWFGTYQD